MQRDSLNIDPVVVLLSLAIWGAIWGIPGMFLSTPLTVAAITILAQFEGSRWIAILLSGDGEPEGRPVMPDRPALAAPGTPSRSSSVTNV
jgi:predicted PurR-regulated permease PerM